jgi:hypothetical protein
MTVKYLTLKRLSPLNALNTLPRIDSRVKLALAADS